MSSAAVKGGRFIAGDPLRGIACIVVLFWHTVVNAAGVTSHGGPSPYYQAELGFLGRPVFSLSTSVWLFFALSGYLIAGPFVRAVVRGDGRRPRALAYARNRVLRIIPGFWAMITVTLIIVGAQGASLGQIASFYGFAHVYDATNPFTPRMVQAWTLDVEVVFYLFVPLLLLPLAALVRGQGTPWRRASIILGGCAVVLVASLAFDQRWPDSWRIVPGSAWAFAPGVALATIEPLVRPRLAGRAVAVWIARILLVVAAAAFLLQAYVVTYFSNVQQNLAALVACGALLAAPLVYQWGTERSWRALDSRFLHWVGVRAYGVYLIHVLVLYELRPLTEAAGSTRMALITTFPALLAISLVAGALSFRFVERPFLERRVPWRAAARPEPSAPGPAAVAQPAAVPVAPQP